MIPLPANTRFPLFPSSTIWSMISASHVVVRHNFFIQDGIFEGLFVVSGEIRKSERVKVGVMLLLLCFPAIIVYQLELFQDDWIHFPGMILFAY